MGEDARRHCAIRFNEVHDYQRSIWANAEETFLVSPILDWGSGTIQQGNGVITIDERGERAESLPERKGGAKQ